MRIKINKQHSIRTRIVSAFLIFAVLQSVLFFSLIYITGILKLINDQTYSSLNFQVTARANELSETMNNAKSGFLSVARQISRNLCAFAETNEGEEPAALLGSATEQLVEYLNATKDVSGVFVILTGGSLKGEKDCVYIRDNSYGGYIRSADSKIYVCGPSFIAKEYSYQLFHLWAQKLDLKALEDAGTDGFYTKPIIAAKNFNVPYSETYYWSAPFRLTENDTEIITLSMPLTDSEGKPFGVCGFEISADFIKKMLPYTELSGNYNIYSINTADGYIPNGTAPKHFYLTDYFQTENIGNDFNSVRLTANGEPQAMIGIEKKLAVYGASAVYESENWSLFGYTDENYLYKYPRSLIYYLIMAQIIILLLSIIYIIAVSLGITHPIKSLSVIVTGGGIDSDVVVKLPVTNIKEIDELTDAVHVMNKAAVASASRLNTLIEMAGISMGGYDIHGEEEHSAVLLTNSMPGLVGLDNSTRRVGKKEWDGILDRLGLHKSGDVCRFIDRKSGAERWLRLKKIESDENHFNESGIIMDVSGEITLLRKTQHERDYDSLTQVLNRRAFFEALGERIENGVYKAGAFIIMDLDNLKYINDTYGHETGDSYLIKTAETLKEFEKHGGLVSRMAGDEFIVFVPCENAERKEFLSLKTDILLIFERCKKKSIMLPNGEKQRLRFSAGMAWYPEDAEDLGILSKYADFAMFEIKHNIKGSIGEFNHESYNRKSYLIDKQEAFDHLVETEDFRYMLQPVVDAKTGEIFAYEMLLRSETEGLKTPYEILGIAKQQSKLYYLEIIGLKNLFKLLSENENRLKNKLIFYNIIKSVVLKENDWNMMVSNFKRFFPKVILEISEEGNFDEALHEERMIHLKNSGMKISLDNFGSGFSSEALLDNIKPGFVKISMSLVRDINFNANKRALVKNIVEHCRAQGIKTIAQGIETYEEMQASRELGIDYYQGFYLACPSYELNDLPQNIKKQIIG